MWENHLFVFDNRIGDDAGRNAGGGAGEIAATLECHVCNKDCAATTQKLPERGL